MYDSIFITKKNTFRFFVCALKPLYKRKSISLAKCEANSYTYLSRRTQIKIKVFFQGTSSEQHINTTPMSKAYIEPGHSCQLCCPFHASQTIRSSFILSLSLVFNVDLLWAVAITSYHCSSSYHALAFHNTKMAICEQSTSYSQCYFILLKLSN